MLGRARANAARHGVALAEFGILEARYHKGPLLLGQVQRTLLVSSGGTTLPIDRLERKGLVGRRDCPGDRRARYAALTPTGERLVREVFPAHAEAIRRALSGLTPAGRRVRPGRDSKEAVMTTQAPRTVAQVVPSTRGHEGAGFPIRRPFPTRLLDHIDPFLLLDEMGPVDYGPGEAKGAPDHPHRGFETVTYLLAGRMRHGDSQGNRGALGPGDVQWMTAGAGVVHSEMPDPELLERGGPMHGFQLWVNLPARDKMIRPRYQDTPSARIPVVTSADGRVRARVIAGEALGATAVIETRTPILYVHLTLEPGAEVEQPVPAGFNVFAYPFTGDLLAGPDGRRIEEGMAAVFSKDGATVRLAAPADAARAADVLLVGGQPLGEPVARYGPFVMSTRAELEQAFEDFRSGRFGEIPAQVG